jgi:tetratricopeptide (TPR) repeat protein
MIPRNPYLTHVLAVVLSWWALWTVVTYRVLGWSVVGYLPWVGSALVALNLLLLLRQFLGSAREASGLDQMVKRLDFGTRMLLVAFAYWAIAVTFNAKLDRSPRILYPAEVTDVGGRTVSAGVPVVYSWAKLRASMQEGERVVTLVLGPGEQRTFWSGESVLVTVGGGRFGLPWIVSVERDVPAYCQKLLEVSPNAIKPWHDLVDFHFNHAGWPQATSEARRYFELHPDDADFAYYVGENANLRGMDADSIFFLTKTVALKPTRLYSFRLAWALTRQGDAPRAVETLVAAGGRYPEAWEFPFLLGYNYAKTGRYAEAAASLERVHELKADVPEVAPTLARLRAKLGPR